MLIFTFVLKKASILHVYLNFNLIFQILYYQRNTSLIAFVFCIL